MRLEGAERRLRFAHPGARLAQQVQRLDELALRLEAAVRAVLGGRETRTRESHARLARNALRPLLRAYRERHGALEARLGRAAQQLAARSANRLSLAQRALHAVSPLATLARGFAIVTRADGTLLTDAGAVSVGETIEARLVHGTLSARVLTKREDS
jgi:exodeoxyribonuclease VII large subunit